MPQTFKEYCAEVYASTYTAEQERLINEAVAASRNGTISDSKATEIETAAQKEAIKRATIEGIRNCADVSLLRCRVDEEV